MLLAYGSLRVVTQWKQELDANINLPNGNGIPVVLLGNKVLHISTCSGGFRSSCRLTYRRAFSSGFSYYLEGCALFPDASTMVDADKV